MIKNRLRVLLAERDLNLVRLAEMADIHPTTMYRFASDEITSIHKPTLDKVCATLGIQPGDIFTYRSEMPSPAADPAADIFTD